MTLDAYIVAAGDRLTGWLLCDDMTTVHCPRDLRKRVRLYNVAELGVCVLRERFNANPAQLTRMPRMVPHCLAACAYASGEPSVSETGSSLVVRGGGLVVGLCGAGGNSHSRIARRT